MTYCHATPLRDGSARMPDMTAMIGTSHRRSQQYGLTPDARPDFSPLCRADLSSLLDGNRRLVDHALPVMETLYQQIANTQHMVLLTDAEGAIVHALGDADFLEKASRVALTPGVTWSEASKGTNAIGTAIAEQAPAMVHADQHFLAANHFLTCSAAPILDHRGHLAGVLDVSGDRRGFHQHTMALVRMSALMVENQLFTAAFDDAITLHFHTRPEFIGTLMEGIASFTPGGRFLSANRAALSQFGLPIPALRAHTFSSLFDLPLSALYDHYRAAAPGLLDLRMHGGMRVRARAELRLARGTQVLAAEAAAGQRHAKAAPDRVSRLRQLDTGDQTLARVLDKVAKVLGRDVPILVTGETGTGKELLARAIHADSPRADAAFVAVNCAAIPDTLIESELFGYEEGAFTGARKKGSVGHIQQAHGGTLFLDEIGDMPLPLQARLLRVLQERVVTPLGGRPVPVDLQLVCASNHDLRQRIAAGLFREDLYYRLNGLVVKLPPLRERSDLETVTNKLLAAGNPDAGCSVSPEVLRLFRQHRWPGNLRQLASLLRTAAIMAGNGAQIQVQHLPDDFLEELAGMDEAPPEPAAPQAHPAGIRLGEVERAAMLQALAANQGNVSAAARALGVSRNTFYRKLPHLKQCAR